MQLYFVVFSKINRVHAQEITTCMPPIVCVRTDTDDSDHNIVELENDLS